MKFSNLKLKQSAYSTLMIIFIVTIILIVNLITATFNLQFDMTKKGLFTLSNESKTIIDTLDKKTYIYALYKQGEEPKQIIGVLHLYSRNSNISVHIIDPDRSPALISQLINQNEVLSIGSIIVKSGSFHKIINEKELYNADYSTSTPQVYGLKIEQKITGAISYVVNGRIPKVYELTGHNETSILDSPIEDELVAANFKISSLNITSSSGIPEDTDIIVIMGPQRDLSEYEAGKLINFLKNNGKLFIALGYQKNNMPNLYSVLKLYDIKVYNGLVMERDSSRLYSEFGDNPFFFAPIMQENPINKYIINSQSAPFLSGAVGFIRTKTEKRNLKFNNLLTTSSKSRLRVDLSKEDDFLLPSDVQGPINVGVTVNEINLDSGIESGARLALIGSPSAFTSMANIGILPGNIKLLTGSLIWLDNNSDFISIPTKSIYNKPLNINTNTAFIYGLIVTIIIPIIIMITSLIIYRKRKNL